jgi:hypothetical protein
MTYEEQLVIGSNLNSAIEKTLVEYGVDNPDLLGALAQAVLIQLDRAGYQIVRKWQPIPSIDPAHHWNAWMDYFDQLAIGNSFNEAIQRVLTDYGVEYNERPGMVSALAQAILIALDQANYEIVKK